jgi:type II secretory pathway component GspD/PulD (secretin)
LDEFIGRTAAPFPIASVNDFRITWQEAKATGLETRAAARLDEKSAQPVQPFELAQNSSAPATQPSAVATTISPLDGVLAFDKELKEATVNSGEAEAKFKFSLTNVSSFDVTITNILTSCGCTIAKMPTSPWLLAHGATGEIPVTMNVAGKSGVLTKTVSVNSDKGTKVLTVKATIRPAEETGSSDTQQASRVIGGSVRDQSNARVDTLVLRKFKVDPNTFMEAIERETGIGFPSAPQATAVSTIPRVAVNGNSFVAGTVKTNPMSALQSAFIAFFRARGVDLSPPKHVFYADRHGDLMVYATTEDLDIIESAIQTLNISPPQINIRVRFIEMPMELAEALPIGWTNSPVGAPKLISILTSPQVRELSQALQNKYGVAELSDGQITTLSGRQVQFRVADLQMEAAMKLLNTNHPTLTNTLPTGPTLDMIPFVATDGYTIEMTLIPTLPEFLGYDDPGQFVIQDHGTNGPLTTVLPLPHFRLRQVTTSVVVWDGQTAVLGGLIPKGDLPWIGKSSRDGHEQALLIFVTPTIIDPVGNRVHTDEQLNSLPNINR